MYQRSLKTFKVISSLFLVNEDDRSQIRVQDHCNVCFYVCNLSTESQCDTTDNNRWPHPSLFHLFFAPSDNEIEA